jgi:preprotein translocase subunit SecG
MEQMLMTLALVLQILSALAIIGLVLVQHGKGADMGASFGSGASGSLFGATGSANVLSKSTAVAATLFFSSTLALAYLNSNQKPVAAKGSVLDQPANAQVVPAGAAPAALGASAVGGVASGAALIPKQ